MQPLATALAPSFHPAFQADRQQTALNLRGQVLRHEDVLRELMCVLDLPEGTQMETLPALVEERLARCNKRAS